MHCPNCQVVLQPMDLGALGLVAVERCPRCGGTWFPPDQLALLGDSVWKHATAPAATEGDGASCPACGDRLRPLSPLDVRKMTVRRCSACDGCWIDRCELEHVAAMRDDEDSKVIVRNSVDGRPAHWSMLRWIGWRLRRCFE